MKSGVRREFMNPQVRPQDDLFEHVNGGWLASTEIPQDKGRYGAFDILRENAEADVRALIEESAAAADEAEPGSAERQVGDLYASFINTERIAELGTGPLTEDLRSIAAVSDPSGVVRESARLQRGGVDPLVHLFVTADAGNPQEYIGYLHQGGLGLPDEAYYTDDEHAAAREAYVTYLGRLLYLAAPALAEAGLDLGEDPAQRVFDLETRIAAGHWDRVTARDAVKSYTRWSRAELTEGTPGWDWTAYAEGLALPDGALDHVVARQPDFLAAVAEALRDVPVADWRAWLTVRLLDSSAPYLTEDFVEAAFDFHGRTLTGTPENKDRWRRGVALVEGLIGEEVGKLYVERHYPPEAGERMAVLIDNLMAAFRARISELEWMGEETRAKALEKLAAFRPKIGHPSRWRDYSAYSVDAGDLLGNVRRGSAVEFDYQVGRIGGPIDQEEWMMTPQTVNAYYHPMLNEIVFPAAILQPPFFDVEADDAVNYGGIGAVIAHEVGHGFDDQGSRYAGDGSLTDWWTEQDRAAFDERAQQLIAQFDDLESRSAPGTKVNGGLTVGENIGDLCGLAVSLHAYRLASDGAAPEIDGWTGDQRFFLGYAQVWQGKARLEEARRLLAIDPHAPSDLRANLARNADAFHEAFGVNEGDGMWLAPQDRVRIF
ncbi:peptidase M13 [Ornithinimicrobium sp. F0845]|uniref:M13 family metallopeptidase n=1 Tax=Ornithinimicrobium sp. F0845 TaxID=2926412 RepID=UPI001FF2133A|nr:M13-type metalloendopeptidase [Ornithinimicrobium sp. F0845]MCK0110858.1 peptidase M13 [Ornithinimicrobium sp. F0845]